MSLTPQELQTQLELACPGINNCLGDWSDKSTWELLFPSGATAAQKAAAQAVIDAAPLPLVMAHPSLTPEEFASRFTDAEADTLYTSTDANVIKFLRRINRFQIIYMDSDETAAAMAYLVILGIITETRKSEILK